MNELICRGGQAVCECVPSSNYKKAVYWWFLCQKIPCTEIWGHVGTPPEQGRRLHTICVCVCACRYKSDVHLCLFINLCMCLHMWACVQWISNVRWKHMRFGGGWRLGAPFALITMFMYLGGGRCVFVCARECLWCFWHRHIAGTTDSSPATWSIIYPDKTEHSLPQYLPNLAMWLKWKERDGKRQKKQGEGWSCGGRE